GAPSSAVAMPANDIPSSTTQVVWAPRPVDVGFCFTTDRITSFNVTVTTARIASPDGAKRVYLALTESTTAHGTYVTVPQPNETYGAIGLWARLESAEGRTAASSLSTAVLTSPPSDASTNISRMTLPPLAPLYSGG